MAISAVLMVHVAAGGVGLATGAAALAVRKGERLHRALGLGFVVSMLTMTSLGTAMAVGMAEPMAIVPGLTTFYLVATAWGAVRRPAGQAGRLDSLAFWFAVAVVLLGLVLGAGSSPPVRVTLLVFSALAAFAAWQDRRMIVRGGLVGSERIARHLWRMCAALAIAGFSFFLGQQDELPAAIRGPHLALPPLAVLGAMVYWLVRVRRPPAPRQPASVAPAATFQ